MQYYPHLGKRLFASKYNDLPRSSVLGLPIVVIVVSNIRVEVGVDMDAFGRAVNKFEETRYCILHD